MFCSHCGKELREAAVFCMYCGSPVGQMIPLNEPSALPRRPQTGDSLGTAALVCGIVSLLICGGFLILPIIGIMLGLKSKRSDVAVVGICLNAVAVILFLIVAAFSFPAILAAREAAIRMQCANHEKIIGLAFHNYHDVYGALPPLYTVDDEDKPLHSWRVLILPFIEEQALYQQIRLNEPWNSDHNKQFHDQMPGIYKCPNHPGTQHSDCAYSVVAGWGFFPAKKAEDIRGLKFTDFTDGISNTLALVEVRESFNWMDPTADVSLEDVAQGNRVGSYHAENVNVLNMDGGVVSTVPAQLKIRAARHITEKEKNKK